MVRRFYLYLGFLVLALGVLGWMQLLGLTAKEPPKEESPARPEVSESSKPSGQPAALDPKVESPRTESRLSGETIKPADAAAQEATPTSAASVAEYRNLLERSLVGTSDIDAVLDWLLPFSNLPLDPKVDLGYWDSDVAAFPLKHDGGFKVYFLKELEPVFAEDGRKLTFCKIVAEIKPSEEVWMEGLLRANFRIEASISFDETGEPVQALSFVYSRIDIRANRDRGIDFNGMEYHEGVVQNYRLDTKESRCLPLFFRNGLPAGTDLSRSCISFFPPDEEKVRLLAKSLFGYLKEVSQ